MPEGPEIRLAADRVSAAIAGKQLVKVFFGLPRLKRFQRVLRGQRVIGVDTRGKAMLTRFSNGLTLYSHNQLYGRWYVTGGELPNTGRSLRVGLHADGSSALLYSASDIEVLDEDGLAVHPFLKRLGPDVLDEATTPRRVQEQLVSSRCSGRSLGALYLDQGFLAGLGNYLRSEILHFAGAHPSLAPRRMPPRQRSRLARATCTVCRRSYRTRGITNPARRVAQLKRRGLSYSDYRFAVFGRAAEPCYECGTKIERVNVAGRRLYFCRRCQPPQRDAQ